MTDTDWKIGRICLRDETVIMERSAVVAEVYSRALSETDGGLTAVYFIVDDLDADQAERAMDFFHTQPSLLVDAGRLVADAGAEFPALVTIRYTDDVAGYMATAFHHQLLRMLPDDDVTSRKGWEIFCALDAFLQGREVEKATELEAYDDRGLRRKVFANRANVREDRGPWFRQEYDIRLKLLQANPEGCEPFRQVTEDMRDALELKIEVGDTYSIVIPTKVERGQQDGAFFSWIPQSGREIVVAHGLDALQVARAFKIVRENPAAYIRDETLLASPTAKETPYPPLIVRDTELNWISVDLIGRRDEQAYETLRGRLNEDGVGHSAEVFPIRGHQR